MSAYRGGTFLVGAESLRVLMTALSIRPPTTCRDHQRSETANVYDTSHGHKKPSHFLPKVKAYEVSSRPSIAQGVNQHHYESPTNILLRAMDEGYIPGWSEEDEKAPKGKDYDFIVVGNGTAGASAVETLRQQCPSARIGLVDPLTIPRNHATPNLTDNVTFHQAWVESFDPRKRRLSIVYHSGNGESGSSITIGYKYGVLLATGARGAPPPHYLIDDAANDRILELRSTIIPTPPQNPVLDETSPGKQRPIASRDAVRRQVLKAAQRGEHIGILGGGWEAVDLALKATASANRADSRRKKRSGSSSRGASLVFGSSAPLSFVLPNYLSSAVAKRIRSSGIDIHERTVVRYVSHVDGMRTSGSDDDDRNSNRKLQLYTAKSYDFMDSSMETMDWLVVAPEVNGPRGSATLATNDLPQHLDGPRKVRSWYQPWSILSMQGDQEPGTIACYKEDGRIVVNSELCAASGVYAAGSVAKYPNGMSGHAAVAGYGAADGMASGRVAASNMAKEYLRVDHTGLFRKNEETMTSLTKDPIHIFRSDVLSYSDGEVSLLGAIGLNALCVGNCDTERYFTHGLWWTNLAAHRRFLNLIAKEESSPVRRRKTIQNSLKPIYGIGVVFYLDKSGRIHGIMSWGLPYTTLDASNHESSSSVRPLNNQLVGLMREIILTNGGFGSLNSEADHIRMSQYLTEQSKNIVALSFAGYAAPSESGDGKEDAIGRCMEHHQLDKLVENFPRPLHRFTEVKPAKVRSVGILKRKDGDAQGILGEDLFARFRPRMNNTPPTKPDMSMNVGSAESKARSLYEWKVWEQVERQFEENEQCARPAREELLWLRKGDEMRNTSARENLVSAYNSAIWSSTSQS